MGNAHHEEAPHHNTAHRCRSNGSVSTALKLHLKGTLKMKHREANTEKNKPGSDNDPASPPMTTGARQPLAAFGSEEKVCGPACGNPTPVVAPKQVAIKPGEEMVLDGMW